MPVLAALALPSVARAQFGGGGGGGMRPMGGMGGPGQGQGAPPPEKPEGPAEEAPDKSSTDVATEQLPSWPGQKEKAIPFFQLNGYLRGRGYVWNNFHLGTFNDPSVRANPFTPPYSELPIPVPPNTVGSMAPNAFTCVGRTGDATCHTNTIKTADMRFRLDPTLNLSQQVRIHAQIDIFDNLVLGSTPDGYAINGRDPTTTPQILTHGQSPPTAGINSLSSAVQAKRAWGEINTPLFEIDFGRMPLMWGTGMLFHDGNAGYNRSAGASSLGRQSGQIFRGDCNDCDYGTTVDRLMVTARLWDHFVQLSWDWAATGPTSAILYNQQLLGYNYNADNVADVNQWTLSLGRKDDEADIQAKLARGETSFNYGLFAMLRTQGYGLNYNPGRPTTTTVAGSQGQAQAVTSVYDVTDLLKSLGQRSAWTVTPDVWARFDYGKLHLEAEGVGVFGSIGQFPVPTMTAGVSTLTTMSVVQLGGLIRGHFTMLKDSLKIAAEVGSASGPQNGDAKGELNYQRAQEAAVGPVQNGLTQLSNTRFTFDPDYQVDMILFRRILGTVYNATYIKPSVTYWLIDNFGGQVDVIYSLANKPATMPGHAINMGMEINARLMYRNEEEGFYAGVEYGVLFNLGALEQQGAAPTDPWYPQLAGSQTPPVGGTTAQAFQAKIMLKF